MTAHLTRAVLAGGRAFPVGTARQGAAAEVVPDGPWWSGDAPAEASGDAPSQPPRAGKGSGVTAWREYADAVSLGVPEDASRDDIIAAVDAAN